MSPMDERITYRAGASSCWVENTDTYIAYDCGPLQSRHIEKAHITAVGVSDDRHLTDMVTGGAALQRVFKVKGGLGGLLIAYQPPGERKPRLATITFDFGEEVCKALVQAVTSEFEDRYVGVDTRDAQMKKMGVSRAKENLVIVAVILAVALVSLVLTRAGCEAPW